MNLTYTGIELRRGTRDFTAMFFVAILPAFMYIVFGASMGDGDSPAGNGNLALYVMISMACFGAVTATTGIGGAAAVERMQGWGRQLGLTSLSDGHYVVIKSTVAFLIAIVPISLIYVLGSATGASGTVAAWLLSAVIVVAGAAVFSLYGLIAGLMFRTEAAISAASGSVVILGFLGNVFFPLSGTMLDIARFTPMYGYATLARYPLTEGMVIDTTGPTGATDPLWVPVVNLAVWATIFAGTAVLLVRRGRSRQ